MNIDEVVNQQLSTLVEQRRYLHMHPELSFKETQTYQYILEHLRSCPHLNIYEHVGGSGIVAKIKGFSDKTVAFRADFDALPIQDQKEVPYKSTVPGVMHACGHDGHTSTLLALTSILSEQSSSLNGNVIIIFQFAEELAPGGAKPMVEDGVLDHVDVIYGNHLWSSFNSHEIHSRPDALMASPDMFHITLIGKGGHGAKPHTSIDAIVAMAQFINQIQTIVSRTINPVDAAVITVGKVEAGDAFNIISHTARCSGTVRTFDPAVKATIKTALEQELQGLAKAKGIHYEFNYTDGYPAVVNHEREYRIVKRAAEKLGLKFIETEPLMVGEDFSYYLQERPGAFFMTGAGHPAAAPHHHPMFDIDEDAMATTLKMFLTILEEEGILNADSNR
ncbi:amidohydrolase [Macrococcus hajekii]|uniref:Amidohydrolase n=1 Tax=Macrococcus hajekii TaxID=198482 RepID=A0A4R6BI70_9STAP|nr:amidohydrolase [Macrococcus hajekii]TDM01221.1 amidohydrolase [Macrococcus hajekii]GGB11575.1 N-acetyl-L,L-diaminopimelate deacetylase [Macrococcus hajekii]